MEKESKNGVPTCTVIPRKYSRGYYSSIYYSFTTNQVNVSLVVRRDDLLSSGVVRHLY